MKNYKDSILQKLSTRWGCNITARDSRARLLVARTIIIVLLILGAESAFAEWYKDYEAAIELIDKGNKAAAIPRLQSAIQQKSQEGANIKFYGMKFGDYFPHYYLGMAYFAQENYTAAIREFELSEEQGAIQRKRDFFDRLSGMKTLARAKMVVKTPEIASNQPPTIPTPNVTPPTETTTKPPANTQVEIKPEEKPTVVEDLKPVETQKKPEEKIAKVTPEVNQKPPAIPPITPADLDPNKDLYKSHLRNGARKYFEGDYDAAIGYLNDVEKLSPGETPVAFLLGCSYASKYLLSGSQNKQLLDNASMMFRRVKKINPKYQPKSKSYLSPAVLEIYQRAT